MLNRPAMSATSLLLWMSARQRGSWAQFRAAVEELRREMAEQQDRLSDVVAALDALIEAMDRHPECDTALAAWQMDGHSPDEIDLGNVA